MNKKIVAFAIAGLLLAFAFTTYSYAKVRENFGMPAGTYNSMIDLMKSNGFEDMAKAMENRDFNSMNNFMNNITEKDYDSMINIMEDNGFEGMAKMMKSVGREDMIRMHNSMGGAQGMMYRNR